MLLPNNKLLTFAAVSDMRFNKISATTVVSILDLTTGLVTQPSTITTNHQMFCSGLAILADGRVLINGGSSNGATTLYNPTTNTWTIGPLMKIPRAYQGTTLLSDGRVFTLGGSWHDSAGNKDGEIFTPAGSTGSWAKLTGVAASRILTADPAGVYRSDNHAWLFGVSGGAVFHAGPSRQMNWITTTGTGTITGAGDRGDSPHAMNGNAVMYDMGKILTVGGAVAYEDYPPVANVQATRRAYVVDITRGPTQPVVAARVSDMAYARSFGNSVVLPDGKVLTLGGQQHPDAFADTSAVRSPELWDPATGDFTMMAPEVVPAPTTAWRSCCPTAACSPPAAGYAAPVPPTIPTARSLRRHTCSMLTDLPRPGRTITGAPAAAALRFDDNGDDRRYGIEVCSCPYDGRYALGQ